MTLELVVDIAKITGAVAAVAGAIRWSGTQVVLFSNMLKDISFIKSEIHDIKSNHLLHVNDEIADLRHLITEHLINITKKD